MFTYFFNRVANFVFDAVRNAAYKGSHTDFYPDGCYDTRKVCRAAIEAYDCAYLYRSYAGVGIGPFKVKLWKDGELDAWTVRFEYGTYRAYKTAEFDIPFVSL